MRPHLSVARGRGAAAAVVTGLLVLALAGPASAAVIDDVVLTGPEGTEWDAEGDYTYGTSGGPCTGVDGTTQEEGFTPADDGSNDFTSDAFDGGLFLMVNGDAFGNGIEDAPQSGQELKVGPQTKSGVKITRIERALAAAPTLRSLIRFRNDHNSRRTLGIVWDSAMGADGEEETRASSSAPNGVHSRADRWITTSDDPVSASLSDPPVVFSYYGPGARERVTRVVFAAEDPDPSSGIGEACIAVRFRITIPANSTRYMVFFTDMALSNADARNQANKYDRQRLGPKMLRGIGPGVRNQILNWDL
jgi:hypothetical protein